MRNHSFTYVVLALASVSALPAQAFSVHRAGSPALAAAAAFQSAAVAPYDDVPGSLSDGQNYFYIVKNAGGAQVQLSVQKNLALDSVRLGFDDGLSASAAVDALQSKVTLVPASIPADGANMAIVTVVPVDPLGVALGSGLSVSVGASALLPGVALPVVDHQDGSYSFAVRSTQPGSGTVVVNVEGQTLLTQPAVTYTLVGPSVCGDGYVDTSNGEQCDGGPLCNADCTASSCGVNGNLQSCTPADALFVVIGQFQLLIDGNPGSRLASEVQVIVNHLWDAHAALTQASPNAGAAKAAINRAIGHLDEAVAAGLSTATAWWRALQLLWISGRI